MPAATCCCWSAWTAAGFTPRTRPSPRRCAWRPTAGPTGPHGAQAQPLDTVHALGLALAAGPERWTAMEGGHPHPHRRRVHRRHRRERRRLGNRRAHLARGHRGDRSAGMSFEPVRVACLGMGWWSDVLADAMQRSGCASWPATAARPTSARPSPPSTAARRPTATRRCWPTARSRPSSTPRPTTCIGPPPPRRPRPASTCSWTS
jgi:hypothetical protein